MVFTSMVRRQLNTSLPDQDYRKLDEQATARGISRYALVQEYVLRGIESSQGGGEGLVPPPKTPEKEVDPPLAPVPNPKGQGKEKEQEVSNKLLRKDESLETSLSLSKQRGPMGSSGSLSGLNTLASRRLAGLRSVS